MRAYHNDAVDIGIKHVESQVMLAENTSGLAEFGHEIFANSRRTDRDLEMFFGANPLWWRHCRANSTSPNPYDYLPRAARLVLLLRVSAS
jgi:hypothetical protein